MCFLPLKSSHYPSRPVPVPELFGKYPTRPVPKSKTPTRQTLLASERTTSEQYHPVIEILHIDYHSALSYYHSLNLKVHQI